MVEKSQGKLKIYDFYRKKCCKDALFQKYFIYVSCRKALEIPKNIIVFKNHLLLLYRALRFFTYRLKFTLQIQINGYAALQGRIIYLDSHKIGRLE